VNSKRTES